jgi:transaldolase
VNVTLLFSVDRYADAANAYIGGLEDRVKAGGSIDKIASVASVFVSRIDTAIDKTLDERIAKGEDLAGLKGKAGIANLKLTYQRFEQLFHSERFAALKAKGATVQRPLWASTSTKNPAYDDLMYVVTVVGAHTVNTMPPNTLDALLDHGVVKPDTVHDDLPGAKALIEELASKGISLHDVTEQLVAEGVKSFAASFTSMLEAIAGKQNELAAKEPVKVEAT